MPAYEVDIEHRATDEVFSYYHGDKMLHFNASLLERIRRKMWAEFPRITMNLTQAEYDLCMNHRGIEEPKVERLRPSDLTAPGLMVMLEGGSFTIVDGHHRLVRRWREGVRTMDFWVARPEIWTHCLVEYTEEGEKAIAEAMPPKVDLPVSFATAVEVHTPTLCDHDGTPLAECKGVACQQHQRCCWQI